MPTGEIVLSLCDRTGVMVEPWAEAGYKCVIVDIQHPPGETQLNDMVTAVGCDLLNWLPPIS
jgi:2-keto-3-deoxy-L-rhamnonate aldolase RhmA